jgi:mRNA-degrading endonuclease YafQ of YafQ-DinJ toxin-antitoxin module
MKFVRTNHFKRDYKKLSPAVQELTDKKLRLLAQEVSHPSLRVKKVQGLRNVFEGSITMDYRFLFQITSEGYILLRIGKHEILEKA